MPLRSLVVRRWVGGALLGLVALSLATWYFSRDVLPTRIRIAGATRGGLYAKLANHLKFYLEGRSGMEVEVVSTTGSRENRDLLISGAVDLALMQSGAAYETDAALGALAPLYLEPLHIVVRRGRQIASIADLDGKKVALGLERSGMSRMSRGVFTHYGLDLSPAGIGHHFTDLAADPSFDAAFVTTGFLNPDLKSLLATGDYDLLPLDDAQAICVRHASVIEARIPRGLYREKPAVPATALPTVAVTAYLAARQDVSSKLVAAVLDVLYRTPVRHDVPTLMTKKEGREWSMVPYLEAVEDYHDPYGGLGTLTNFMESLSAVKELLFAFAAVGYLLWQRYRRLREVEREQAMQVQKDHLDEMLLETIAIEKAQIGERDLESLWSSLREVTRIKIRALEELTDEDLRGDQTFAIFLQQCSSLMRHIQAKIDLLR